MSGISATDGFPGMAQIMLLRKVLDNAHAAANGMLTTMPEKLAPTPAEPGRFDAYA